MKKSIGLFMCAMVLSVGTASFSDAAGDMTTPGPQSIKGDLLKIEGEFYTLHDTAGHDVRLHVDKTTKLDGGPFKTGDKVEAQVTDKNHALSMSHANPAR